MPEEEDHAEIYVSEHKTRAVRTSGPRLRVPDALMVAAIPLLGYAVAHLVQRGFCDAFGIPANLIVLDTISVVIAMSALLSFGGLALFGSRSMVGMLLRSAPPGIRAYLEPISIPLTFLLMLAWFFRYGWFFIAAVGMVALLLDVACLIIPALTPRGEGNYLERLRALRLRRERQERIARDQDGQTIVHKAIAVLGAHPLRVIIASCIILPFAFTVGRSHARIQRGYLVANTDPEMVNLAIYGDKMILAPFHRDTKQVEQSFVILKVGEDPDLVLTREEIGPLRTRVDPAVLPDPVSPVPTDSPDVVSVQLTVEPIPDNEGGSQMPWTILGITFTTASEKTAALAFGLSFVTLLGSIFGFIFNLCHTNKRFRVSVIPALSSTLRPTIADLKRDKNV
jgi:hypothetical protein